MTLPYTKDVQPPMPAIYAHYRFGAAMLQRMPGDLRRTAKRHRNLFDVGLHGPDLLFYQQFLRAGNGISPGSKFHRQTGREFFGRVCRSLRLEPSEAAQAYLYGVLCHYTLDSRCHPQILTVEKETGLSHARIEALFDRFLMDRDGKPPRVQLTGHMKLDPEHWPVVSRFYPGIRPGQLREGLRNMARVHKLQALPEGPVRHALADTLGLVSGNVRDMLTVTEPDPEWEDMNRLLFDRYGQAAAAFPDMLLQLGAHLAYNAPLGEAFASTFG